ncbi:MAG: molybdate-binding protein, partial [Dehalococcoidia bacterium]|nr:molybdate-binding protein [Dehalococcoidia bacterium]
MARALAAAVAALVVGLAALACGGSDPEEPPAAATQ